MRPVIRPIYGVFGDFAVYVCPLRTSLYQLGCSTARSSQEDEGAKKQYCSPPSVAKTGLVNPMRDVHGQLA